MVNRCGCSSLQRLSIAACWSENYNLCTIGEMLYKPGVGLERKSGAK